MKTLKMVIAAAVFAAGCAGSAQSNRSDNDSFAENVDDSFASAWESVTDAAGKTADAGEWTLAKTKKGGVRAYRATQRVAGNAGEHLSDEAIEANIASRLVADPDTKGLKIDVDVNDGDVTLNGDVDSTREAREAMRIALDTPGVDQVTSNLHW
jgi:osmotically-inducible protein OsmY